jgi:hypothetical protein
MSDYLRHITQIWERLEASKFDRGLCLPRAFLGKEEKYRAQVPFGAFRRYFFLRLAHNHPDASGLYE